MISGIGIDILYTPRLIRLLDKSFISKKGTQSNYGVKLAKRILSPLEFSNMPLSNQDRLKYLANRWTVKEALYKADNSYTWKQISLDYENKKPVLKGTRNQSHVSISHDGDYVIALVVLQENENVIK